MLTFVCPLLHTSWFILSRTYWTLQILAENHLHSAPVIEPNHELKGVLSVWDICQFVVSSKLFCCSVAAHPFHIESPSLLVLDEEKKKQLKEKFNVLSDTKVSDVMREMLQMTLNDISYLVARENVCVCVCVCVFFCVSLCACPCVCGFLCE